MAATLSPCAVAGLALLAVAGGVRLHAQADPLVTRGQVVVGGKSTAYVVRHLPVNAFPELPEAVAQELVQRGCMVPQTYQAHQPENVVRGSFQRAGSRDWAVLCSVKGTVSLLVFFGAESAPPQVLKTVAETSRVQAHDASGVLGFDWGIDAASSTQVHQAQSGLANRPAAPDHDALAATVIDHGTVYHFYRNSAWSVLEMPD